MITFHQIPYEKESSVSKQKSRTILLEMSQNIQISIKKTKYPRVIGQSPSQQTL